MPENIIYYDGVCNLCSSSVRFILMIDKNEIFDFKPLQQADLNEELRSQIPRNIDSIILLNGENVLVKSDAIIKIFEKLGGFWYYLSYLKYLPKSIRDKIYDFIAENRYKLFGKKDSCEIISRK